MPRINTSRQAPQPEPDSVPTDPQTMAPTHPSTEPGATALSRRSFLARSLAGTTALALGGVAARPLGALRYAPDTRQSPPSPELLRSPDSITVYRSFEKTLPSGPTPLVARAGDQWQPAGMRAADITVQSRLTANGLVLTLASPHAPVAVVHVRWQGTFAPGVQLLGDAWERSYGDLGWRNLIPERVMPWYFAAQAADLCHGYGVRTDARALCFWQVDQQGVSLWLNVTNGGDGVVLGQRQLPMATIVMRHGRHGEPAVDAVAALCRMLCARPARPRQPIYGANDWCYSYGTSTAASILRDTDLTAELSPSGGARPFSVIDEGWVEGTPAWPSMAELARGIRQKTVRPGIWIRPLEAAPATAPGLLLPKARFGERQDRASTLAYDPTVPEAQAQIRARLAQLRAWQFELIKHDFSTYDLLGQWGFEMGPQPTLPGWSFYDRSRTNAEILADLYALLREAVGEQVLLDGCNTVGHLGQGVFDLQRIGDDTSGHQWERTRRMGVNALAFRLPQQGSFFTLDPDVVGLTERVPWRLNQQWLQLLATSGAATMVSLGTPARGQQQRAALREAFQIAAAGGTGARPLDWFASSVPELWQSAQRVDQQYHWSSDQGASPFLSP